MDHLAEYNRYMKSTSIERVNQPRCVCIYASDIATIVSNPFNQLAETTLKIWKNGIQKYSLEDTKLYNEIGEFKSSDTLYNASVPFLQNNNFTGDKIQIN